MINVFSQCVRLGLVDTCLPSGYYRMFVFFFLPYKQHGDIFYKLEFKCNMQSLGKTCYMNRGGEGLRNKNLPLKQRKPLEIDALY